MNTVDLTEEDLVFLLGAGVLVEDAEEEGGALITLSRKISSQHTDILARWAAQALRGEAPDSLRQQVRSVAMNLHRLAEASDDLELVVLLMELTDHLAPEELVAHPTPEAIRTWGLRMAALLPEPSARKLRELLPVRHRSNPLFDALAQLRGIGPRRLDRLYRAGLHTVESLADADPLEVAQATGIPRILAGDVVEASAHFAVEQRRSAGHAVTRSADEVRELLHALRKTASSDSALVAAARAAIAMLQAALDEAENSSRPSPN